MTRYPSHREPHNFVTFNASDPIIRESLTRFHSRSTPGITVLDYLKRIVKFTNVEVSVFFFSLSIGSIM